MDRVLCYTTILVWLACAGLSATAVAQSKAPNKAPAGGITGRVTINGKGAPGIVVGVRNSESSFMPQPSIKGTTDADGNYQINDLLPGNYAVSPIAPTYILSSSDVFRPRDDAKTVLLSEGETVNNVDFSLTRGGVITGKVTDADGRPVVEESVQVLIENQAGRGWYRSVVGMNFRTDDRGIYRIYGVPPGRYRVAVGQSDDNPFSNPRFGRAAYKRTYYPDATEASAGEVVEVTEGSEATNVDITVGRSLPTFVASGKAVDGEGRPMNGLWLGTRRQGQNFMGPMNSSSLSNEKGEFRIENLTPGKFVLVPLNREGTEILADPVAFEVIDHDVTGLVVKTRVGQSLSGSIVLENTIDRTAYAKLLQQRLWAYVHSNRVNGGPGRQATLNGDGTFRVAGLPAGSVNFSLSNQDGSEVPLFTIVRVEHEGVEQPQGVEIKDGENVVGVKLVVAFGSATVRGQVKFENGELPANTRVYVFLRKVDETGASNQSSELDVRGHFLMKSVPAGSYEININIMSAGRPVPGTKQLVSVSEGTVTDVAITVDLKTYFDQVRKP